MSPLLQEIAVGCVAFGAAAFVLRRIIQAVRPEPTEPGCEHCAVNEDRSTQQAAPRT